MANFLKQIGCVLALAACVFSGPLPDAGMFGKHFQGDIKLTETQANYLRAISQGIKPSTGVLDTFFRWGRNLQGNVEVPYLFNSSAVFSE